MKTKEELESLKEETEALCRKVAELNDEELNEVVGGMKMSVGTNGLNNQNRHSAVLSSALQRVTTGVKINRSGNELITRAMEERINALKEKVNAPWSKESSTWEQKIEVEDVGEYRVYYHILGEDE